MGEQSHNGMNFHSISSNKKHRQEKEEEVYRVKRVCLSGQNIILLGHFWILSGQKLCLSGQEGLLSGQHMYCLVECGCC